MSFSKEISIAGRKIGPGHPTYIIAEMSANHGQDLARAKELVHAAFESGADAIKLQTYTADTLTLDCKLPHFEAQGAWKGQFLHDLYKKAHMPWGFHEPLIELANKLGLTIFSAPFDNSAVDLLESFDSPAYKIASPEIIDHELIRYVAKTGKPIIMSTGGATLTEVSQAVDILREEKVEQLCILKCTSTYPAPPETINLNTIPHLAKTFNVPVGLSDHTLGNYVPIASVACGVNVIEKHFVMSKDDETADSFFSMTPDELEDLVKGVRQVELAMGAVEYATEPSPYRRCLYITKEVRAGQILTRDNVANLRPGGGELRPQDIQYVIGQVAKRDLPTGTQLAWSDFSGSGN